MYLGKDAASQACGEFAGCVNRELFMECRDGDCATGKFCQNRRYDILINKLHLNLSL
jgi:hypothetical protein